MSVKIKLSEQMMHIIFFISACVSILAVVLICYFIFVSGVPAILEITPKAFLGGTLWKPLEGFFGILPMIMGSIYVTTGGVIVGVPIGILCAIFMARFCPEKLYKILKPAIELLAGVPSIVYGFFGLVVLVPMMRNLFGGSGKGILTASVMLGIMILPTIIGVAESAIRAVPESYYEGALGLGATHERAVFFAVLPAAKSGVLAGVILGIGRVIGETMAVVMVAGNQPVLPNSIFGGVRTLTSNIVLEMGYASGLHKDALIATAVVLFVFILVINLSFSAIKNRGRN
ncbi:MAG: phosphate ABC transporter permease subunit PstC [Lachnospiraceae bacterium]|nr:phosphate ABC transporter permease subunit PstC [Lachnospiraceae bacterium]